MSDGWCLIFFDYCQGIADIAVKLFIEVQRQAVSRSVPGVPSTITPGLVAAVWEERFKLVHEHLSPAKNKNPPQEPAFGNAVEKLTKQLGQTDPDDQDAAAEDTELRNSDPEAQPDPDAPRETPRAISKAARAKVLGTPATRERLAIAAKNPKKSKLAEIVEAGAAKGMKPHEAIRDAGRPPRMTGKPAGSRRLP